MVFMTKRPIWCGLRSSANRIGATLRLKLLEIYFVWGNKDAFLQTAKGLEATRDRAPAGEWDKIVIMGKQICPDEPLFASTAGSGRGAGALVDLNLEGGENRVDIDLFGDPEGERSRARSSAKENDRRRNRRIAQECVPVRDLDFTLDTPERGADDSPTREMAAARRTDGRVRADEFRGCADRRIAGLEIQRRARPHLIEVAEASKADQTAEVSIDDLGLDLDHLEETRFARRQRLASGRDRSSGRCADHGGRSRREVAAHDGGSRKPRARSRSDRTGT